MAITHLLSINVTDYAGKTETVNLFLDGTLTVAEVQTLCNAVCVELDPITGAKIMGASVGLGLTIPGGLKATPVDDEDMNRGINWRCDAADNNYSHTVRTPAATNAIVDGEEVVETADTTDWETILLDGDATNEPTDPNGNDLTSVLTKRVTFHK